jgi:hypothetical protein
MFATSAFSFLLSCLRLARFVFLGRRPHNRYTVMFATCTFCFPRAAPTRLCGADA